MMKYNSRQQEQQEDKTQKIRAEINLLMINKMN